jgi:hypothetical protein
MLQNLQRLPINGQADRSTQLMANIRDYKPDVVLLNNVGLCWCNIPTHYQWQERTRTSLPPHKSKFSYNKHGSNTTKVQWGALEYCSWTRQVTGPMDQWEQTQRTWGDGPGPESRAGMGTMFEWYQLTNPVRTSRTRGSLTNNRFCTSDPRRNLHAL